MKTEGIDVPIRQIIGECNFAQNAMLTIGEGTPYKAVVGQTPNLLQDFEHPTVAMLEDGPSLARARCREIALQSILSRTAEMRISRSLASRTRPAGELEEYEVGDLVDMHRAPQNKDTPGWRGPCTVVDA